MISAWKLKNSLEVQDLFFFLFKFLTRMNLEFVLRSGPWSVDRSLLILERVSGEEQPSYLNMHLGIFWVRIYKLPLMLRSDTIAKKIGNILGSFEEMDLKDAHQNGRFLRIMVTIDLRKSINEKRWSSSRRRTSVSISSLKVYPPSTLCAKGLVTN
ncbi:unnamed protein product [Lathyrus sativus]|nr:unnamed protein product [Lathyrus sativus]